MDAQSLGICTVLLCVVNAAVATMGGAIARPPPPPPITPPLQFSTGFSNYTILQRGDVGVSVYGFVAASTSVTVSRAAMLCWALLAVSPLLHMCICVKSNERCWDSACDCSDRLSSTCVSHIVRAPCHPTQRTTTTADTIVTITHQRRKQPWIISGTSHGCGR